MIPKIERARSTEGEARTKRGAVRPAAPQEKAPDLRISNQRALKLFGIRAKLTVSQPGDPDELEADRLADAFIAGRSSGPVGNQQRLGAAGIMRKCASCAEEEDASPIMRRATGARMSGAPLRSSRGGGSALSAPLRAPFERFYRADLSGVRVHTDATAQQSAMGFGARAYAQGADLVFGPSEYAPHTQEGLRLLAHELAHVVQHTRSPNPHRIARQILSPDEMFGIITRERAFTFSPGGGAVCEDPRGVGRGVGAAAGGRRAGSAVFAVIQITDRDGRPVALSYGDHISYADPHAEQRAVAGLNRTIPQVRDLSGGTMTVVVDQVPCPPGRANCMGTLEGYARERGLRLNVYVPTRERVGGGGAVAPRTAAMSSMRTDVPPVGLRRLGGVGGGGGVTPPTGTPGTPVGTGRGPIHFVPPRPAPPGIMRQQASAMAALSRQTQRSIRVTARIQLALRGVGGLLTIIGAIHTIRTAQQMATRGTILGDAEAQADRVAARAAEMEEWAIETTNEVSQIEILAAITSASEREDTEALFDIDTALTHTYQPFGERADEFEQIATDLRAREQALQVMVDYFRTMTQVPIPGAGTVPQAEAFAMYVSLERLHGRVNTAATHYEAAHRQMRYYEERLREWASTANSRAWSIIFSRVAVAVSEAERERELEATMARERRLNQIHEELEAIEAELNQPVCRPPEETEPLLQRREALLAERALLGSTPSP